MRENEFRNAVAGVNISVPVMGGRSKKYINFDNAASTPPLISVWKSLEKFKDYYSSVHRGTGYKSVVSTEIYDKAHDDALDFVSADKKYFTSIFVKNTTEGLNKIARRMQFAKGDIVLTSLMEHHSNDLPWRAVAQTVHVEIDDDGFLDLDDYRNKLKEFGGRVKLVAISGASNVTGLVTPIKELASMAHDAGAEILVDAAQLAPHRRIDMGRPGESESIDYLVYAGHKMYAPFGAAVLIGPKERFLKGDPDSVGGGTVSYVTLDDVQWAHLPDKEEAGSPNVIGALALSSAIDFYNKAGFDKIKEHEIELTKYALERFSKYKKIKLYGPSKWLDNQDRLGVISFNMDGCYHGIVAAILSYEGAIAVRNGCFCAHPYIQRLMKISDEQSAIFRAQINNGDRSVIPGMVRVSFGIYNTIDEIDRFFRVIDKIIKGKYKGEYEIDKRLGQAYPKNFQFPAGKEF